MVVDDAHHIWHTTVAELNVEFVTYFVEFVVCGEMFVYKVEKCFSYVDLYFFVVGVEPDNVSFSFIFICALFSLFVVFRFS